MRRKLITMLAPALLVPSVVLGQPPGYLPSDHVPRRLPPTSSPAKGPENEFLSLAVSTPGRIQQAQFVEPIPGQVPETLPPGTPSIAPVVVGGLTLADLENMALTSNPSIARAAALVQAARGNHIQVGIPPNPSFGYSGQQIGSRGMAEQDGVFVSQEIVRGGKLRLNREVAAQEWARAEQELAAQEQRVLTDVRIAYYEVLIAQRQERLTNDLLRVSRETLQVAENLLKGKEVGRVDVVQSQLEVENAAILAQNATNRRTAAWQSLSAVAGNPHLPLQQLDGDVEEARGEYAWNESLQLLLTRSPEIAAAMANVERARWAVQRALVEKKPNVTVEGLVNWRDNGIGGRSDGAVVVGVPLPLWNRNQGGVIQAQHQVVVAERAIDQLELSLQNRLAPVFERYANALNQVTKYRSRILPFAQESLDLTRQLYQGGETGYISLLTAQRTYSQTNLNYLQSLSDLRAAEAEIEGLLLGGSLEIR